VGRGVSSLLAALSDRYWQWRMAASPTEAILLGDHRYDAELEDLSRDAEDAATAELDGIVAETTAIDPAGLSTRDRVTRGVLLHEAATTADEYRSRLLELAVDPSNGIHVVYPQAAGQLPLTEPEQADAVVAKWSKFDTLFEQAVHRLRQGVATGRTPPRVAVDKVIAQVDAYLASPLSADPFIHVPPPPQLSDAEVAAWRERLADAVSEHIRPGYQRYREALVDEIAPKARPPEQSGIGWIPDGEEAYARAIRRHTSLDLTPLEIHETGKRIISDLADEYRRLSGTALGTTDLTEIFARLRDDPSLRFDSPSAIVGAARTALDAANAATPDWFGILPKSECVLGEIPGPGAEEAPLGYYFPPAGDGTRPGTYFVNTTLPTRRTRYEAEALAFHEAVPGHHLQTAIAQELGGIPEFRKFAYVTAYVEGWALYTERLADEMGLYSGDVGRLGMLSFDSWRASRLVVDTGFHALGWSRQEAIDYMLANSPQSPLNIETEVDRYIGWPGQALAYMTGRQEIVRLRTEVESSLGGGFDIKAFHDVVLGSGPVPLLVLGELVSEWVAGG
jgi:uncharacterized protein (DUF885 family)